MVSFGHDFEVEFPVQITSDNAFSISMAGLFENIVVKFGNCGHYDLCAMTIERLENEISENRKHGRPFIGRPGLIISTQISTWILTIAIHWMNGEGYFSRLMPSSSASTLSGRPELILPESYYRETERELTNDRGYLEGGMVAFGESGRVPVNFYVPWRIRCDIELDALSGRPFYVEPGLVVVSEISRDALTSAVNQLAQEGYFDRLRPI